MPRTCRIPPKGQTTILNDLRERSPLRPGAAAAYELEDENAQSREQAPLDVAYLSALETTLGEWDSPEDAAAFNDL